MDVINIEATDETPAVVLDAGAGKFEFSGKSLPEDVTTFYDPILEWMDRWAESSPTGESVWDFKMDYFNTASSKLILDILMKLEEYHEESEELSIKIRWFFLEDDEDMEEAGEEFEDIIELPFEQVSY